MKSVTSHGLVTDAAIKKESPISILITLSKHVQLCIAISAISTAIWDRDAQHLSKLIKIKMNADIAKVTIRPIIAEH